MTQWRLARLVVKHAADGIPRRTLVEDLCRAGLHPVDAAILVAEGGPSQTLREWLVMAAGLTIAIDAEHVRRVLKLVGEPEGDDLAAAIRASEQEERAIVALEEFSLYGHEMDEDEAEAEAEED
jgi:hypothetical protein